MKIMKTKKLFSIILLIAFLASMVCIAPVSADTVGVVGDWNLDENGGINVDDATPYNNDGLLTGGMFGNGIEFDGINDNVLVDDSALDLSGMSKLTLEAWVYVHSYPSLYGAIVTKWYQSNTFDTYGIWISSGHKLVGALGPQIELGLVGTSDVTLNTWHYVTLVYDSEAAGTAKLFLDGNLEATRTGLAGNLNSQPNPLYVGCDYYGIASTPYQWRFFDGVIDEVRISNDAHTITLPTSAFSRETDTVALWHFDDSKATSTVSDSTAIHTGTLNGAVWAGPTWTAGQTGSGLHFDGLNDYVRILDDASLEPATITVECYVKSTSPTSAGQYSHIISKDFTTAFGSSSYALYTGSNYGLYFYVKSPTGYALSANAGTGVWNGLWHHVVGTFDGVNARLYVDETEVSGSPGSADEIAYSAAGNLLIGKYSEVQTHPSLDFCFYGDIDGIKIYNYAINNLNVAFDPTSQAISPVNTPANLRVIVTDSANTVEGITVNLASVSADLTLSPQSGITGSNGVYQFNAQSAVPGVYTITASISTLTGTLQDTWTLVIYDPSAGFATGGGWINSPTGAYAGDLSLSGKATFGFVSKYQKGASVPTGNTEFVFHAASFKFKSTIYDWLVVAGSTAQYKGEGTINGAGSYKFMLWADDGGKIGSDTFRLCITDSDGAKVYDNGVKQAILGGSIVVHK